MATIPRIDLPGCGGWIEFGDPNEITRKTYAEIQRLINSYDNLGAIVADAVPILARVLITGWQVPYLREGGRILPMSDPTLIDDLKYPEAIALEQAFKPTLKQMLMGRPLIDDVVEVPEAPLAGSPSTGSGSSFPATGGPGRPNARRTASGTRS